MFSFKLNRRRSTIKNQLPLEKGTPQIALSKSQFIIETVEKLPEAYRKPFLLKQSGSTPQEISKQLQLPLSIAERRIELAGQCIKHAIQQKYKRAQA